MNVLYTTYQTAFQNPGGGETQLRKTCSHVNKKTPDVDLFDPFESTIEEYDVLHAFSSHYDNLETVRYATNTGVPTAISTIYWEPLEYFRVQVGITSYIKMVEDVRKRLTCKLRVTYLDKHKQLYDCADLLLPNSQTEANLIANKFNISKEKFHVVPNAEDERFADATPEAFENTFGYDDFILFVGYLSPRKNLITMLEALHDINQDIVVIGTGPDHYVNQCKQAADDNVHFLGRVDHNDPLLESAYAGCDTFVLPSWYETPGLAALEAALAGAKIVVTDRGSTEEYFEDFVWYVDPSDPESIRKAVMDAVAAEQKDVLSNRIRNNYLWSDTARESVAAYEKLL